MKKRVKLSIRWYQQNFPPRYIFYKKFGFKQEDWRVRGEQVGEPAFVVDAKGSVVKYMKSAGIGVAGARRLYEP